MNSPETVVGCSTCGALYTPAPGDQGLCTSCRTFLPDESPAPAGGSKRAPTSGAKPTSGRTGYRPSGGSPFRLSFRWGRTIKRVAMGLMALALVGAVGGAIAYRPHMVTEAWLAAKRGSVADAWAAIRHLGMEGWTAARRHLPIGGNTAEPQQASSNESRGPHKRPKAVARK